jgi:hypothetical protein
MLWDNIYLSVYYNDIIVLIVLIKMSKHTSASLTNVLHGIGRITSYIARVEKENKLCLRLRKTGLNDHPYKRTVQLLAFILINFVFSTYLPADV